MYSYHSLNQNHSLISRGTTKGVGEITGIYHLRDFHRYLLCAIPDHSLQLFAVVHSSSFGCGTGDTLVCFNEDPKGYENPKGIEEEQVHPLVHEVGCNKIRRTAQPFGNECHPPCNWVNVRVNMAKPAHEEKKGSTDHRRVLQ